MRAPRPRRTSDERIATLAVIGLAVFSVATLVAAFLPRDLTLPFPAPFDAPRAWPVALFFLLFPGLVVIALTTRLREFRRAARWAEGRARITRSAVAVGHRKRVGAATQVFNTPAIAYAFDVGGRTIHGTRIGIGEDPTDGRRITAVLARFPEGAEVPVFYDPMRPEDAVLDRGRPPEVTGLGVVAVGLGAAALGSGSLVLHGDAVMEWLLGRFPAGTEPPAAIFFGLVAAVTAWIAVADARTAARAARWPTARGAIVSSVVDSFLTKSGTASRGGAMRVYQAVTEYAYVVDGREYHGSRECFGGSVAADEAGAAARAGRYVAGAAVDVHYDPANPTDAVLETRVGYGWFSLAFAVVCGGLALYFAGAFAARRSP